MRWRHNGSCTDRVVAVCHQSRHWVRCRTLRGEDRRSAVGELAARVPAIARQRTPVLGVRDNDPAYPVDPGKSRRRLACSGATARIVARCGCGHSRGENCHLLVLHSDDAATAARRAAAGGYQGTGGAMGAAELPAQCAHVGGLVGGHEGAYAHDARSALTMLRRAARAAGRNPPTMPITMANVSAAPITPGDSANPKPISEKLWKLMTEIRSKDRRAASATPMAPPTSASTTDSTKNAPKTLRRRKPRARRVPTSTVRFATAAYMVIIAPIIAPKLKMVVTTRPRIRMNFASVWDCSL